MTKILSLLALTSIMSSACFAETWTYGLDADGVVVGWKCGKASVSGLARAVSVVVSDKGPGALGIDIDDEFVSTARWVGGKVSKRSSVDIAAERAAKIKRRRIRETSRALAEAKEAQTADPSLVTDAEMQAFQSDLDRVKK